MNDKKYYKLGLNIRHLRKSYGMSQLELANELGIHVTAISNYELGERIPERDILLNIAKIFRVTEHELLYDDFSHMADLYKTPVFDAERNKNFMVRLFPVFYSEEAMKNEDFKKAFELHTRINEAILSGADCYNDEISNCTDLYDKAITAEIIEAVANQTAILLLFGMLFCFTSPQIVNIAEKMKKKEISAKEVLQTGFLSSLEELTEEEQSWQEAHKEFVKENEVEIIVNIYRLKHSKDYSELGDYYMALRYLFGVTSTSVSDEMARAFGNELMLNLRLLDNPYAKKFCNDQE